ncbi:MAG: NADH-quinone oxidoreductase subunit NuoH [Bacteroidia bacterium]|nr:NADH-quinone oxidoreductase subunit NuoH [Bacteroidia bacterium]
MTIFIFKAVLIFIIFLISLGIAAYSTYAERKVAAFLQDRIGPDRAGPFGLLQPLADGVKMFLKEEIIPTVSDKWLFILGPCLFMVTALMTSAVIPWGMPLEIGGKIYKLQVADLNIGILYILGVVSLGVYGIMIGGWSSNNKFALLGAIRASSQMISYELAMGMSVIAIILISNGSLSLTAIVESQKGLNWNVFYQPVAFLIFIICAFAECNRTPFDLPESESELIGGYHTEYSSMKLGLYLFAEYINMFISSAVISCLFFGGYNFPGLDYLNTVLPVNLVSLISIGILFVKIFFFIFFFMWIRWTIPRFRYDQLMRLGWQILMPLSIINVLVTGAVLTFFNK